MYNANETAIFGYGYNNSNHIISGWIIYLQSL